MIFLKEDGSLDIERINALPLLEYMNMIGDLTDEQMDEYRAKQPINESKGPKKIVHVDFTREEAIQRGWMVDAEELLNNLREKYGIKKND